MNCMNLFICLALEPHLCTRHLMSIFISCARVFVKQHILILYIFPGLTILRIVPFGRHRVSYAIGILCWLCSAASQLTATAFQQISSDMLVFTSQILSVWVLNSIKI